jgi:hypothetical protein
MGLARVAAFTVCGKIKNKLHPNKRSKIMSGQPLTYEGVLELFRELKEQMKETDLRMKETDRQIKETDRQMKETDRRIEQQMEKERAEFDRRNKALDKKISALGSRIGEIVENMVGGNGNIVDKFQAFGYEILQCARNVKYAYKKLKIRGEIDLFLEDGDVAILIEVKTTLETADVRRHIERLEEYRRYADARGDKRRFIGAVAGAVVDGDAEEFAHQNGMYVIVQSGEAVEIVPVPEGFQAKKW